MTVTAPILWLVSWYPNKYGLFDGDFIQRHAVAMSANRPVSVLFVKKGVSSMKERIEIDTTRHGELTETTACYRPWNSGFEPFNRLLSFLQYLFLYHRLISDFIHNHGLPEIVHVHVTMRSGILAYWLKKKHKVPYIITEHWTGYSTRSDNNFYQQKFVYRWFTKIILRNASLILPVCHYLEEQMKPLAPSASFEVIGNVVNTIFFRPSLARSNAVRFFHASSLHRQKNPEALLRAFATLPGTGHTWEFRVAGPVTPQLRTLAYTLGIHEKVIWLGEISYEGVAAEMRSSDVLVMYSRFENLPCVVAEALCCGLTVISNRVGGLPEMIDSSNGILVDTETELQNALLHVLSHETIFNSESIAARASQKYNYEKVASEFEGVYRRLRP